MIAHLERYNVIEASAEWLNADSVRSLCYAFDQRWRRLAISQITSLGTLVSACLQAQCLPILQQPLHPQIISQTTCAVALSRCPVGKI